MSSPIHKALFSPPPSPPSKSKGETVDIHTRHGIVSLKALLVPSLEAGSAAGGTTMSTSSSTSPKLLPSSELKARSPRTPQNKFGFTLDTTTFPSPGLRSGGSRAGGKAPRTSVDVDATPRATGHDAAELGTATPRRVSSTRLQPSKSDTESSGSSSYYPTNVPSASLPIPSSLPKPVLRLMLLLSLLVSSVLILVFVPTARMSPLGSFARRNDDGTVGAGREGVSGRWTAALESSYVPPQVRAPHMMKRAFFTDPDAVSTVPKTARLSPLAHPLPETHEILAIQSYLLESAHHSLPSDVDTGVPLDASRVSSQRLGKTGSAEEQSFYAELDAERGQDVVIWYGADGKTNPPGDILDVLRAVHGNHRKPTLLPVHDRQDRLVLSAILERLAIPISHFPLVMIGKVPVVGDVESLEELRGAGALAQLLKRIDWVDEEADDQSLAQPDESTTESDTTDDDQFADMEDVVAVINDEVLQELEGSDGNQGSDDQQDSNNTSDDSS